MANGIAKHLASKWIANLALRAPSWQSNKPDHGINVYCTSDSLTNQFTRLKLESNEKVARKESDEEVPGAEGAVNLR